MQLVALLIIVIVTVRFLSYYCVIEGHFHGTCNMFGAYSFPLDSQPLLTHVILTHTGLCIYKDKQENT